METIRRILVAFDFSAQAERAATLGVLLARAFGARLYVLHVVYDLQSFPGVFVTHEPLAALQTRVEAEARDRLEKFVHERLQGDANVEICLATGAPAAQILHTAHAIQADLLLLGAHAEGKPAHRLLGETVGRVAHEAPCPVTIVPPSQG